MGSFAGVCSFDTVDRLGRGPRTVRLSWSSMVIVPTATWTVTVRLMWTRPRAIFCPATIMTPVLLPRGGPAVKAVGAL